MGSSRKRFFQHAAQLPHPSIMVSAELREDERRLEVLIRASSWLTGCSRGRAASRPAAVVGGRWGAAGLGLERSIRRVRAKRVKDVDVAFFDLQDLSPQRDEDVVRSLRAAQPAVAWDAKNQAAVHIWYPQRFGFELPPLRSSADGVATWPETATAVAVRLERDGRLVFTAAAGGVADLINGVCRRNPRRVSPEEYRRRLKRKDAARRWPNVIIAPGWWGRQPSRRCRRALRRRVGEGRCEVALLGLLQQGPGKVVT